jgi:hypothetical protein
MLKHLQFRAIGYGFAVYLVLSLIQAGFINYVTFPFSMPTTASENSVTALVNIIYRSLQILTWLVPGYLVGRWAKDRGLTHGAVVGTTGFLVSAFLWQAFPMTNKTALFNFSMVYPLILAGLLTGLAAAAGELHATKRARF